MKNFLLGVCILCFTAASAQDDLLTELDSTAVEKNYATAVFKGLQVVTLQTTKMPAKKELYFVVSHRFGKGWNIRIFWLRYGHNQNWRYLWCDRLAGRERFEAYHAESV